MYRKFTGKKCPTCGKNDEVVKVTYKGCEKEVYIECERCWLVIGEDFRH